MTRDGFLAALRANLRGLPAAAIEDIISDYASHFDAGKAAGRSETEIAAALGDPARLARELRAEAGLKRWDEERSASAAAGAVLAILSLGAIDLLLLLPILLVVCSLMFAFACVAAALMVAGLVVLLVSPFALLTGGFIQGLLAGLGLLSAGVALAALQVLKGMGLTDLLIRYGRFHLRLLKPIGD
jgi:uncharacterized membrane protein